MFEVDKYKPIDYCLAYIKNLRKFIIFRYVNVTIFIILFHFYTANAAFINSEGETLSVIPISDSFLEVYLNEDPIGLLNKGEILDVLKVIDYILNFESTAPFDIRKAHLDIYGSLIIGILTGLIIKGDSQLAVYAEAIYFFTKIGMLTWYLPNQLGEDRQTTGALAVMSGLSPISGMFIEWFSRLGNFNRLLHPDNIKISDRVFYKYVKRIKENTAKNQ